MKRWTLWLLACAASLVLGCGAAPNDVTGPGEESGVASEELTSCSATCQQGTVSCPATTTTCSATQYVGVTCDGISIPCPSPSCSPSLPSCADLYNKACNGNSTVRVPCCDSPESESFCQCNASTRRYVCA
ncbi:hypothetical protein LZ198_24720 [Myxococcus sp. K15C18031901]|uniref:hypothetical protein n=1 Tax=Myxococcus dinghuensis TaxID=2906761 RepID=UPI0020A801AC|nr:hypothetical protein [Myxococcus dinghuensis]MCP3102076.1 hypothetical protein [Myxococcus dinghuensis]